MKLTFFPLFALLLFIAACSKPEAKPETPAISDIPLTVLVKGMHCESCVKSTINVLKQLSGVKEVEVDLDDETAIITPRSDSYPNKSEISEALQGIGYEAEFPES